MIGFPTDFAAELAKRSSFPFWTAVFHFPSPRGDTYVTQYPATIAGQKHELIITGLGAIGPLTDRKEPKIKLDVNKLGFRFLNQPAATSTGERFSAYFPSTLESVLADIYLTFRLSDGSFVQPASPLYSAVVQGSAQYGYDVGSLELYSLSEKYLNAPALRLVDSTAFPYAPASEIGKAIPVVHGNVTRSPGRIVRQTAKTASAPKPATTNIGTGILASIIANATAVSEAWTLTMNSPATVAQTSQNAEWTPALGGAIAFDAASSASTAASGATLSWSHTCTGSRRLLFVYVATNQTALISVTYGGVAMTLLTPTAIDQGGIYRESVWYLIDPPAGANTVVVTPALTGYPVEGAGISYTEATFLQSVYSYASKIRDNALSDGVTFSDPGASSAYGLADTDFLCDGMFVASDSALTSGPTPQAPQTSRTSTVQSNLYHSASTLNSNTGSLGKGKMAWNWTGGFNWADATVGVRVSRRWEARARSFVMPSTQTLGSVQIWCRQNSTCAISGSGRYASVAIYTNSAGAPGTLLTSGTAVPTTTAGYLIIPVPTVSLTSGTTYWLVVSTVFDIHGVAGVIYGVTGASGTYAIGRMSDQLNSWVLVSSGNVGDIRFQLQFVAGQYTVTGSVTGADGTGNTNADFTSTSGRVTVKAAAWSGSPIGGDVWTWSVSAGSPTVIFSDSPQATPISALGSVYYAGLAISGASISQLTDNEAAAVGKATDQFGVKHAESVVINSPTLGHDIQLKIAKVGAPTAPLTLELRADSSGQPTGNVVASAQIAAASVTGTPTLNAFTFSPTVVLAPGTYWILGDSTQSDDLNYYTLQRSTTDTYAAGTHMSWDKTAQKWVTVASKDLVFQVTAATITKSTSALDDAGVYAAFVTFDVDIGSGVTIEADVTGIKDNTSGTYTGTASALIQQPPDVIYWWLAARAGVPSASIDAAGSFNAAKAALNSLYQFNGVLQDAMSIKATVLKFCFESRCLFDWAGPFAQLKYLQSVPPPSADLTITLYDLIMASGVPDITIQRIPIDEVVNSIDARWSRQAYTTSYANLWHQEDAASVAAFGALKRDKYFQYDFLTSLAAVRDNVSYQLARNAWPNKRRVAMKVPLKFLAAEKEDTAAINLVSSLSGTQGVFPITLGLAQNLAETLDRLDGNEMFSVEAKQINADDMSMSILAREY